MNLPKLQIYFIWFLLLIIFYFFTYQILHSYPKEISAKDYTANTSPEPTPPSVAWDDTERYLVKQYPDHYLDDLKQSIINGTLNNTKGHFGVYLKDLESGAWLGINEDDKYKPWSLIKIPIVATLLEKVERRQLSLHQPVVLTSEQVQAERSLRPDGNISTNGMPMRELINRIIELSDNTTLPIMGRYINMEEYQECLQATGLLTALSDELRKSPPRISPRQYASLLKSLYYSSYLQPPFSQLVLALMSDTIFGFWLKAGLPTEIKIAHKVGFNAGCGDFHDCGIIYLPHKPYILCVMSTGSTREEADRVVPSISRQVYNFQVNHK